jgi:TolB-like protein
MILSFAGHSLDRDRAELRGPEGIVALEPKAFAVLALLAENHDRVVDKDEMIEVVWGGRFMSDAAVTTVVKQVRRALGDDGAAQGIIRTVRGRGYRLVAPVSLSVAAAVAAPVEVAEVAGPPTIAVLPFARAGLTGALEVLGDAIPAEIISALSRLRWVRVIARESAFRFRGATVDFAALRGALGAGYALSGTVEAVAGRIAVDVDLVATQGGVVIWSERFGGTVDDLAEIRARILGAVVAALDLQIPMAEAAQARLKPVEALDAWSAYHLGLSHMYRFNSRDNAVAAGLFARATQADPGFANAWAARSFTSYLDAFMEYGPDRAAAMRAAREEAERSVELDPLGPYGNFALGRISVLTGRPDDGIPWLDRAVQLSPSYAKGHYSRALLQMIAGRGAEALTGVDLAEGLSPLDPMLSPMRMVRALAHSGEGDFAAATPWAELAARTSQGHIMTVMAAAAILRLAGRTEGADHWTRVARDWRPDASIGLWLRAIPLVEPEGRARFAAALRAQGFPD